MKKKLITVLGGVIIALSLFVSTGNTVKAAKPTPAPHTEEENCSCHDVTLIFGEEKEEIISNLLLSKEFNKMVKKELKEGFVRDLSSEIEVIKINQTGQIMIGVPFINKAGEKTMAAFSDGEFLGTSPR
jgi:hypothetical protein